MFKLSDKAYRIFRFATSGTLLLVLVLNFFPGIHGKFIPNVIRTFEEPSFYDKYYSILPGMIRYFPLAAAVLFVIGKRWSDAASFVLMMPAVYVSRFAIRLAEVFEPMGGLGGYRYSRTFVGWIVTLLVMAAWISIFSGLVVFEKKSVK